MITDGMSHPISSECCLFPCSSQIVPKFLHCFWRSEIFISSAAEVLSFLPDGDALFLNSNKEVIA